MNTYQATRSSCADLMGRFFYSEIKDLALNTLLLIWNTVFCFESKTDINIRIHYIRSLVYLSDGLLVAQPKVRLEPHRICMERP